MHRHIAPFFAIFGLLASLAWGQSDSLHPNAGSRLFSWLLLDYDAVSIGLSGAQTSRVKNISSMYSNPATSAFITRPSFITGFQPYILDIYTTTIAGVKPVSIKNKAVAVGGYIQHISYGSITEIDEYNVATGKTLSPYSIAGAVTGSARLSKTVGLGAALKGMYEPYRSSYGYSSSEGIALDMGAVYQPENKLYSMGVAIRNAGWARVGTKWESDMLPTIAEAGVTSRIQSISRTEISCELSKPADDYLSIAVALEHELYRDVFCIRGGYALSTRDIQSFYQKFFENSDESGYISSNFKSFSLGISALAVIGSVKASLDASYQLRTDGITGSPAVSITGTY